MHQGGDSLGAEAIKQAFAAGLDGLSRNDLELMDNFTPEDHARAQAVSRSKPTCAAVAGAPRTARGAPADARSQRRARRLVAGRNRGVVNAMLERGWRRPPSADDVGGVV